MIAFRDAGAGPDDGPAQSQHLNQVFEALSAAGIAVRSMRNRSSRLEQLFLHLMDQGHASGCRAHAMSACSNAGGRVSRAEAIWIGYASILPTFILAPRTYLGGVFYSVSLPPEPWQSISLADPILYMVNAMRFSVLGVSDIAVPTALALVAGFNVLFAWLRLYLMRRGAGIKS